VKKKHLHERVGLVESHFDKLLIRSEEMRQTVVPNIRFKDITQEVTRIVALSEIHEGIVAVQTLHTTTALIVNENEEGLVENDIPLFFQKVCSEANYAHDCVERLQTLPQEPANGAAHLRSIALSRGNPSVSLIIANYKIHLGTWQSIILYDFDPDDRPCRTVIVQILGNHQ